MSRVSYFNSPYLVGFDEIERTLDRVSKSAGDGYPPYNIERIEDQGGERLRITLAVAGFARDEIEVLVEENQLVVRGKRGENGGGDFLHRGIAARQFQRIFVMADGMKVTGAMLENGLLAVELLRPRPERLVRSIEIESREA